MAKSDDSILENIWDFILGSLRLIFFLVIFTLTIVSVIVTVYINLALYYGHSQALEYVIINAIVVIPLLALLLGTHGFFYKNTTTLHWFTVILLIAAALTTITAITLYCLSEYMDISKFEEKFKAGQKEYSWLTKPTDIDSDAYVYTTFWDGLQAVFGCCGIEGPQDWTSFAPKGNGTDTEVYPKSCCSHADVALPGAQWNVCSKTSLYQGGCSKALRFSWKTVSIVLVVLAALYSLTAGLSFLIIRETNQEEQEARQEAVEDAINGESISLSGY